MSKKNTDQVLADPTAAGRDDDVEEVPVSHEPETFDVGAMVAGVRATRVRVKIQPHADLLERLQELADEIDAYPTDDDVPDDVVDDWVETKARFDHVDVFVIEGRTSDWAKQFVADMKKRGINPERKGLSDGEKLEHTKRLWHAQIAAQCVSPEGVTEEDVAAIFAANEAEGDKLWRAVRQVNTQPVKALVPDFSQRVSRLSRRG